MSSTVTTTTVVAVMTISHTPGLARVLAVSVLAVICLVLLFREVTANERLASVRRFRSGLTLCLIPLALIAALTMLVDERTINQFAPAVSPASERMLIARGRVAPVPWAAAHRVDLGTAAR
jgi:hypothetical protein